MPFTKLRYHLIWHTYNSNNLILPRVEPLLYKHLENIAISLNAKIIIANGTAWHIHILAGLPPSLSPARFVQKMKNLSSLELNKSKKLNFKFYWNRGYAAFTLNPHKMDEIYWYIKNQKRHHAESTTIKNYEYQL